MATNTNVPEGTWGKAEAHLRRWSKRLDSVEDIDPSRSDEQPISGLYPSLTVSREAGAGAKEIVDRVAEEIGCDVVDRQILDYLGERYKWPRDMLEILDEKVCNWLVEALGMWLAYRMVRQSDYVSLLGRLALMAARDASVIFVGRGVQFILPREKCLAIQIVAPRQQRIERIKERHGMNQDQADRYVTKRDTERRRFIRHHFLQDAKDPLLYDLVINTGSLSATDAVEIIERQWQSRFGTVASS